MTWSVVVSPSIEGVAVCVVCVSIYMLLIPNIVWEERHVITKSIFLRALSLITACALYSLRLQCVGLFGDNGLFPLANSLKVIQKFVAEKPTADIFTPEYALHYILSLFDLAVAVVGVLWPHPVVFAYLYISYYAYKRISGPFLNFQWDSLLLECLFVSIPLALSNSSWMDSICIWLCRFLLFRLMFGSGIVKAYGRDPSWFRDYTAMRYHFLTQPLPSEFGRWVSLYCPPSLFSAMTVGTLVAEVLFPLLSLLCIPSVNAFVVVGYAGLMISINLTGYYGFFNILMIAISSVLLSDSIFVACLQSIFSSLTVKEILSFCFPQSYLSTRRGQTYDPFDGHTTLWGTCGQLICIFINTPFILVLSLTFGVSILRLCERYRLIHTKETHPDNTKEDTDTKISSESASSRWSVYEKLSVFQDYMVRVFYVGNHYGLFANMTKQRDEIFIEVAVNPTPWKVSHDPRKVNTSHSSDTKEDSEKSMLVWHPIVFKYKPDDVNVSPKMILPFFHMPRLDWCLWFLSLKPGIKFYPTWFWHFLLCLVECDTDVLSLLHPKTALLLKALRQEIQEQQASHEQLQQERLSTMLHQATTKDTKKSISQEENQMVGEEAKDTLTDGLFLRVSLWRYTYAIGKKDVLSDNNSDSSSQVRTGHYWQAAKLSQLVEPINRNHLQHIYEQAMTSSTKAKFISPKPTVETAQEIIMRTLFKKLKARREEKKSAFEAEYMDLDTLDVSPTTSLKPKSN